MGSGMSTPNGSSQPASWPPTDMRPEEQMATFAGGCFWSVELAFQRVPGVSRTAVGYTGGHQDNPSYEEVCRGNTGHTEAVQLTFDPRTVSYDALCDTFFHKIDPLQKGGQGNDWGPQYRTVIFYHDVQQKQVAEARVARIPGCAVEVQPSAKFWPAEQYHQQYLEKGGRNGNTQCAAKGCNDPIRCYG